MPYSIDEKNQRSCSKYLSTPLLKKLMTKGTIVQYFIYSEELPIGHVVSIFNDEDGKSYYIDTNYSIGPLSFETAEELLELLKCSNDIFIRVAKETNPNLKSPIDPVFNLRITQYLPNGVHIKEEEQHYENLRKEIRACLSIFD